ncbi:hypothetical protein NDA15_003140 [Ustilago hordei]|nr:hypothetical protein NDA15_003140 [Ustilago hordei]
MGLEPMTFNINSLMISTMPPSTRAGQTGREERDDDQAAATAGNGQEEGWLTQVVRILQLANPVLTAEEAIVQAMGLVSISNQAPRGEAEKIPKDVLSAIAHIKKLSDNNWHTWEPTFIDCLQQVHNAKEILYGKIAPGSEGYDEDLDKVLNDGTQVQFKKNRRQGRFNMQGQALALELEETINDIPEDNQNTGNRDNNSKEDKDSYLWHERFRHPGRDKTRQIQAHYLGTDERMEHESKHCNACSQGKQTRAWMSQLEWKRAEAPLELVHVDLMTDLKGHANYHYALVAVDDFSSLIYMEPLCTKSAALPALRRWITRME